MPLETPTYEEVTERVKADIANELPDVDPNIHGSFVRALAVSNAGRHYDSTLLVEQLVKQLFPQTAVGEFLERWAQYEGLSRTPAQVSSGNITVTGVLGTSLPALTQFVTSNNIVVSVVTGVVLANQAFSISSLTRSGTTVTAVTSSSHTFATGLAVTIAGAVETDYNGAFVVTVLSDTSFSYEITGTPTTPATGTITGSYVGSSLDVESIETGAANNLDSGTQLTITSPITGIDDDSFVQILGLTGGADEETDAALLERTIQSRSNPVANFNPTSIEKLILSDVPGVTRVFIKRITPYVGAVTVSFMRDNDTNAIPDAGEVQDVRDVLLEILPAQSDPNDLYVLAPVPVPVNFTFSSIIPNTDTMKTAIEDSLAAFFSDEVDYETDVNEDKYRSAIVNTVDIATGDVLESFNLTTPIGNIPISTNEIGTLGTVTI